MKEGRRRRRGRVASRGLVARDFKRSAGGSTRARRDGERERGEASLQHQVAYTGLSSNPRRRRLSRRRSLADGLCPNRIRRRVVPSVSVFVRGVGGEPPPREGVSSRAGASPREARPDPSPPPSRVASFPRVRAPTPASSRVARFPRVRVRRRRRKEAAPELRRRFAGTTRLLVSSLVASAPAEPRARPGACFLPPRSRVVISGVSGVRTSAARSGFSSGFSSWDGRCAPRRPSADSRAGAPATTPPQTGCVCDDAPWTDAASRGRSACCLATPNGCPASGKPIPAGGRSALRSSGFVSRGALFSRHVTTLSLGPRETRATTRRNCDGVRQTRARARRARASRARPAAGAHAAPSRARRAFRLPASSSRALFSYPTRVTTRDRRFPRASRNARVRRAKARRARASRRRAAPRARATKTARPCASARRDGSSEARGASTRGPARARDPTGFFRRVLGVRGQPPPSAVHSAAVCASETRRRKVPASIPRARLIFQVMSGLHLLAAFQTTERATRRSPSKTRPSPLDGRVTCQFFCLQ